MMRATVAVLAGFLCAALGMRHGAALRTEETRLRRWVDALQRLAVILRGQAVALPEALHLAAGDSRKEDVSGQPETASSRPAGQTSMPLFTSADPEDVLHAIAAHLQAHPLCPVAEVYRGYGATCTEQAALMRLFAALGRGTLESRLLAVTQCTEEMALLAASAKARADRDAKLYQTLGWTGGACLTLILL